VDFILAEAMKSIPMLLPHRIDVKIYIYIPFLSSEIERLKLPLLL